MKEIIDWLIGIEDRASKVYEGAASRFQDDIEFAHFLRHLAGEEKMHHEYMRKASEFANDIDVSPVLTLTDSSKQMVETDLLLCEAKIKAGTMTKKEMFDYMVSTEFSEWNSLFLFVINSLKHTHREFIPAIVQLHQHKRSIEKFLESKLGTEEFLERIRLLPAIWHEKILVVDNDNMIADLLQAILEDEGHVETAINGKEGLKKLGEKYFAAIITDVAMPVMNGIEFYNEAVKIYPQIKERFLFFTGSFDQDRTSFFRDNDLKYIKKPSTIREIKEAISGILTR